MTLPPQIELRARCAEVPDLSGLIFRMQITAGYKNPYGIFFPKTDSKGHTRLSAAEIERQFTDHWEMALMDHNGTMAEANELVTVSLWDPQQLRENCAQSLVWPLSSYEETRWTSRREWIEYMISCGNEKFAFGGIAIRLPETSLLYLPLKQVASKPPVTSGQPPQ
jgi:hypothetical protein